MRINREALRDQACKLGLTLIAAGFIGAVVETGGMTWAKGVTLCGFGLGLLLYGILEEDTEDD